jgi:hypothetical protein
MITSLLFAHSLLRAQLLYALGGLLWVAGAVIFDRWYYKEERNF